MKKFSRKSLSKKLFEIIGCYTFPKLLGAEICWKKVRFWIYVKNGKDDGRQEWKWYCRLLTSASVGLVLPRESITVCKVDRGRFYEAPVVHFWDFSSKFLAKKWLWRPLNPYHSCLGFNLKFTREKWNWIYWVWRPIKWSQ